MHKKLPVTLILFFFVGFFTRLSGMQEQLDHNQEIVIANEAQTFSLFQFCAENIIQDIAHKKRPLTILNTMPQEVAQKIINTPFKGKKDTLAHFCIIRALRHKELSQKYDYQKEPTKARKQKQKATRWISAVHHLVTKGFALNTVGDTGMTLAHYLVQFKGYTHALELLSHLIFLRACFNTPYNNNNVLEMAINYGNFEAVTMLTEETLTTLDLEMADSLLPCFIKKINALKDEDPMYKYLFDHLDIYRQRSNNQYVIAPCCENHHEPYYPKNILT